MTMNNEKLSYRRETAVQGALVFLPKVEECDCMWYDISRTL